MGVDGGGGELRTGETQGGGDGSRTLEKTNRQEKLKKITARNKEYLPKSHWTVLVCLQINQLRLIADFTAPGLKGRESMIEFHRPVYGKGSAQAE